LGPTFFAKADAEREHTLVCVGVQHLLWREHQCHHHRDRVFKSDAAMLAISIQLGSVRRLVCMHESSSFLGHLVPETPNWCEEIATHGDQFIYVSDSSQSWRTAPWLS
jgi:hypothetical protein